MLKRDDSLFLSKGSAPTWLLKIAECYMFVMTFDLNLCVTLGILGNLAPNGLCSPRKLF